MTASSAVRILVQYDLNQEMLIFFTATDWSNGQPHIDIWTGSPSVNGGQNQINCEDNLTLGGRYSIVRNPPTNYGVDSMLAISSCKSKIK